ncbi:reverse transcriptase protein [Pleurostoma richardsiae]|uniref:Reverse transcriptase protein n=1 Tax=Pleurostoma richardsiae TaxID=41990 RepID=A0AA38VIJ2_9PEZI|nr:reverse transcriptase protein [Pleurostoma richardsiae]
MRDATLAGPARQDASQTAGIEAEDAITVAPEGDEGGGRILRRQRKPSEKAIQNKAAQDSLEATQPSPERQDGNTAQGAATYDAQAKTTEKDHENEQATLQTLQGQMNEQTGILKIILEAWKRQEIQNNTLQAEISQVKNELQAVKTECQAVKDELNDVKQQMAHGIAGLATAQTSPNPSYADVARTAPTSHASNVRTLSSGYATVPSLSGTLYCTVDTSRVEQTAAEQFSAGALRATVEKGVRVERGDPTWRCQAVTQSARNAQRIRIACRDETERRLIKNVLGVKMTHGARLLRDDLYPVKVDGVVRSAALDPEGNDKVGAAEEIGKENGVEVAKVKWLSSREPSKTHGSIVIHLTKAADARRLLAEKYCYAGGLSGQTAMFEPREGPKQCYNCQEITEHKAYQCTKPQTCAKCAKQGHHHSRCTETIAKCVPCGGPHESFSKNCRKLYPSRHE